MKRSLGYAFGNTDDAPTARTYDFPADLYLDLDIPSLYNSWSWAVLDQDAYKIKAIQQAASRKAECSPEIQQLVTMSGQTDLIGFFQLLYGMSFNDLSSAQKGIITATWDCAPLRILLEFRYVPIDMETFKLIAQKPDNFCTLDDFIFIMSHLSIPFSHEHVLEALAVKCSDSFLWLCLPNLVSCPPDLLRAAMILQRSLGIISAIADLIEYVESSDITFAKLRGYPEEITVKLSGKRIM